MESTSDGTNHDNQSIQNNELDLVGSSNENELQGQETGQGPVNSYENVSLEGSIMPINNEFQTQLVSQLTPVFDHLGSMIQNVNNLITSFTIRPPLA